MRNRMTIAGAVFATLLVAGCGNRSPTQPTTPATPGPTTSADPVARLQIRVDDGTPRDAIASMSDVVVDASASTGSGALTFSVDFGDGTSIATATARHTYSTAGEFTIVVTVTDAQGRTATSSSAIVVKAVTGRWFEAEFVKRSNRVEIRQLTIEAQDGLTVRGQYRTTGNADRSLTGTLTPPRKIQIAISGGAGLLGLLPDRLNDETTAWTLIAQGDTVDGERLDFRPIVGDPTAGPPVADMKVQFGNGTEQGAFPAVTPVRIDGTGSRGSDLSYFIEFGDGGVAATSTATRVVDTVDRYTFSFTARLTVVDRFGRIDSRSLTYPLLVLKVGEIDSWYTYSQPEMRLGFGERSGATYTVSGFGGQAFAVLSGENEIRITAPAGIELRGNVVFGSSYEQHVMTLVQRGGANDGRTWVLRPRGYS